MAKSDIDDLVKKALKEKLEKRKAALEEVIEEVALGITEDVPAKPAPVAKLAENQEWLSIVIDNKTVSSNFPVTVFKENDWDEKIQGFIPKINPSYVIDKDIAGHILRAWELDEKVLCYGPTGAGKSSLIEQLCARTGRPFVRLNCTGDMDSSMIFGQLTAKDGSTIWVDGAVTEAVKYGAVFAWDEWDVTPPEISMGLQWLLEDDGKLFLKEMPGSTKEKQLTPHKDFRLVAIGNTQGQGDDTGSHAGTNVQNSATLDRFGTAVYIGYLPSNVELQMLSNKWETKVPKKVLGEFVKLAGLIRQGYQSGQLNLTVSPRSLLSICKKVAYGCSIRESFALVYTNKLNDTQ